MWYTYILLASFYTLWIVWWHTTSCLVYVEGLLFLHPLVLFYMGVHGITAVLSGRILCIYRNPLFLSRRGESCVVPVPQNRRLWKRTAMVAEFLSPLHPIFLGLSVSLDTRAQSAVLFVFRYCTMGIEIFSSRRLKKNTLTHTHKHGRC